MASIILFAEGTQMVKLELESFDSHFEALPTQFTTRYTLRLNIVSSMYTTSHSLDFYKRNLEDFLSGLKKVYATCSGSIRLSNGFYDHDFLLVIESYETTSAMRFDLNLYNRCVHGPEGSGDRLSMTRIIDQSTLPNIIYSLEQFLSNT